jgi:hypothetical protein
MQARTVTLLVSHTMNILLSPLSVFLIQRVFAQYCVVGRSQWQRGLRRGSAAARLTGLRVRIPRVAWVSVFSKSCVLTGRGCYNELITRPEESYPKWCIWVWSWRLDNERPWATKGYCAMEKCVVVFYKQTCFWRQFPTALFSYNRSLSWRYLRLVNRDLHAKKRV